jgi:hypothetical protein
MICVCDSLDEDRSEDDNKLHSIEMAAPSVVRLVAVQVWLAVLCFAPSSALVLLQPARPRSTTTTMLAVRAARHGTRRAATTVSSLSLSMSMSAGSTSEKKSRGKILVLGGTGYLGQTVCQTAIREGYTLLGQSTRPSFKLRLSAVATCQKALEFFLLKRPSLWQLVRSFWFLLDRNGLQPRCAC